LPPQPHSSTRYRLLSPAPSATAFRHGLVDLCTVRSGWKPVLRRHAWGDRVAPWAVVGRSPFTAIVWCRGGGHAVQQDRYIVDVQFRPIKPAAQFCERLWNQTLVHLHGVEDRIVRVYALEVTDDVSYPGRQLAGLLSRARSNSRVDGNQALN